MDTRWQQRFKNFQRAFARLKEAVEKPDHSGSDIDLAIIGDRMDMKRLRELKEGFAESSLPYNVNVVDVSQLSNESLKKQILTTRNLT
jgi:predicted nucleotidyltransferase